MNKNKGFSLIEVMLSVAVLAIAIIGMLTLLVPAQQAGQLNTDRIIARHLAQEGLEIAEFQRSINSEDLSPFYQGIWDGAPVPYLFINSYNNTGADTTISPFKYDITTGFQYTQGSISKFTRVLNSSLSGDGDYLDIVSTVTWMDHDQQQSYSVSTRLYDIY